MGHEYRLFARHPDPRAVGKLENFLDYRDLPSRYRAADRGWAQEARRAGGFGSVSRLDRRAYHPWRREAADRGYSSRNQSLVRHDLDPDRDITLAADLEGYIVSRIENGRG